MNSLHVRAALCKQFLEITQMEIPVLIATSKRIEIWIDEAVLDGATHAP